MGHAIALLIMLLIAGGCAEIPKESVTLSATLGRDLHEVHRAHREIVVKYFGRTKDDINGFVDHTYRPYMIKNSMRDFDLIGKLKRAETSTEGADALAIMEVYVTLLTAQIEGYRQELLGNINRQETEVLLGLDNAYEKLQNANAIVTGYLASVRKVQEAQAEMLQTVGLEEWRKQFVDKTVAYSDRIAELTEKAQKAEEKIDVDEIAKTIKNVTKTFE